MFTHRYVLVNFLDANMKVMNLLKLAEIPHVPELFTQLITETFLKIHVYYCI